jgi:hypothetical protein
MFRSNLLYPKLQDIYAFPNHSSKQPLHKNFISAITQQIFCFKTRFTSNISMLVNIVFNDFIMTEITRIYSIKQYILKIIIYCNTKPRTKNRIKLINTKRTYLMSSINSNYSLDVSILSLPPNAAPNTKPSFSSSSVNNTTDMTTCTRLLRIYSSYVDCTFNSTTPAGTADRWSPALATAQCSRDGRRGRTGPSPKFGDRNPDRCSMFRRSEPPER